MKYIYMNESVHDKDALAVAVWDPESKHLVYAKTVDIIANGEVVARVVHGEKPPKDLPHEAVAWVEVYEGSGGDVGFFT